uniref:WASH1 WAHD domain-containing protein n=1 Tax=Leersia perrieri TaxID=77586 RepID=A0A0D9VY74_9ORYZ
MLRVSEDGGRRRREAHAAGYGELGRALLDVQEAADQVFDAVSKRTAEERDKLSAISRRINAAKKLGRTSFLVQIINSLNSSSMAKIKTLSQSKGPLTIVSPAQHPSSSTNQEDFRPLFHDKYDHTSGRQSIATISVNGGFNREYGLEGTLELFQFFSEENCHYNSNEGRLKVTNKLSETKYDTYLGSLLDKSNFPTPQNISISSTDLKNEELPPPPPSLISKHLTKNQRSDDVRTKSSGSPAHSDIPGAENSM